MTLLPDGANRKDVLWVGGDLPDEFRGACKQRGLCLRSVGTDQIGTESPRARALILEVSLADADFCLHASQLVDTAVLHGLAVGLVVPDNFPEPLKPAIYEEFYRRCELIQGGDTRVRMHSHRHWDRVTDWIAYLPPSLGANKHLRLLGDVPTNEALSVLLQRAFYDEVEIQLKALEGGKSGAKVWKVERVDSEGHHAVPLVAKAHSLGKINDESSRYHFVNKFISKRHHATLDVSRSVEGRYEGLSVYDLVDNAEPFREALGHGNPAPLVTALFQETLHRSSSNSSGRSDYFAREIDEDGQYKVLRWSKDLCEAVECARLAKPELPSIDEIQKLLKSLPTMQYQAGFIHGDLHAGNLFVPVRTTEVSIIDFGRVSMGAPLALDPACLEVSLTFPPADAMANSQANQFLKLPQLRDMYKYPLPARMVQTSGVQDTWLSEAVKAIRREGREIEPDDRIYSLAVAAFLLRAASFGDHIDLPTRALASELGANLIYGIAENFQ